MSSSVKHQTALDGSKESTARPRDDPERLRWCPPRVAARRDALHRRAAAATLRSENPESYSENSEGPGPGSQATLQQDLTPLLPPRVLARRSSAAPPSVGSTSWVGLHVALSLK